MKLFSGSVALVSQVLMMALVLSATAFAAPAVSGQAGAAGKIDFNHMSTGFPLIGGHATAACETCHVGGVFKGTPRNCDGCHAVGKRVVATPKSNSHIVTDAPCESCHFNTSTFLGARYNHGTALPEQCRNCHNGRIASGKPASHNSGKKATDSCDHCHRTSAFLPASWNHVGVAPGTCTTCHNGSAAIGKPGTHTTIAKATYQCDECHSFIGWNPARYKHNTSALCSSCHNGTVVAGKPGNHVATTDECNQCHTTTISWLPALGAKPANHIPYNAGTLCSSCHAGGGVVTGAALHAHVSAICKTCHNKPTPYLGRMDTKTLGSHEGSSTSQDCISCHAMQYNKWNNP